MVVVLTVIPLLLWAAYMFGLYMTKGDYGQLRDVVGSSVASRLPASRQQAARSVNGRCRLVSMGTSHHESALQPMTTDH